MTLKIVITVTTHNNEQQHGYKSTMEEKTDTPSLSVIPRSGYLLSTAVSVFGASGLQFAQPIPKTTASCPVTDNYLKRYHQSHLLLFSKKNALFLV